MGWVGGWGLNSNEGVGSDQNTFGVVVLTVFGDTAVGGAGCYVHCMHLSVELMPHEPWGLMLPWTRIE